MPPSQMQMLHQQMQVCQRWHSYRPAQEEHSAEKATWSCTVCDSNNQPAERKIPVALRLTLLDDTSDATRLNADNQSTNESSENDIPTAQLRRSTWQKNPTLSCTVYNQNRKAQDERRNLPPLDTKKCAPMLPYHCTNVANSMHANVITKPA